MQIKSIDPVSLKKRLDEGKALLIDVRETHEHAREHIEGARLAPLSRFHTEDFREHHDKTAVFYCHSGGRTGSNARLLASKGFRDAYHLSGGIMAWKAAGLPTQSKRDAAGEGGRKRFGWLCRVTAKARHDSFLDTGCAGGAFGQRGGALARILLQLSASAVSSFLLPNGHSIS